MQSSMDLVELERGRVPTAELNQYLCFILAPAGILLSEQAGALNVLGTSL